MSSHALSVRDVLVKQMTNDEDSSTTLSLTRPSTTNARQSPRPEVSLTLCFAPKWMRIVLIGVVVALQFICSVATLRLFHTLYLHSKPVASLRRVVSSNMTRHHSNSFLKKIANETLSATDDESPSRMSMVIINSPYIDFKIVQRLWSASRFKICADGGANRLYFGVQEHERRQYIPDFVVGDLDSLENEVRDFYSSENCKVIQEPDQDTNDLDKSLTVLAELTKDESDHEVIIVGPFGGRFDQEMANIHALYRWQEIFHRIVLVDASSTTFLLNSGRHVISPLRCEVGIVEGGVVGLLPIGGPVRCLTTTGLQWNLDGGSLEFGKLVSSSNRVADDAQANHCITIETSDPLIWNCSFEVV